MADDDWVGRHRVMPDVPSGEIRLDGLTRNRGEPAIHRTRLRHRRRLRRFGAVTRTYGLAEAFAWRRFSR